MSEVLTWYSSGSQWKTFNLWVRDIAFRADYISRILDLWVIQPWDNVVEFWSWQGHKSKSLLQAFPDINFTWVELSPEMITKAQKRIPEARFMQWDMTNSADVPDNIEVALYFQSLHHLDINARSEAAQVVHEKLPEGWKVVIIDSFHPDVQSDVYDTLYRAYAVLSQHPWNKLQQLHHSVRSLIHPDEYDASDYWYYSPEKCNILWISQSELFHLHHQITPFMWKAISDILVFEKR